MVLKRLGEIEEKVDALTEKMDALLTHAIAQHQCNEGQMKINERMIQWPEQHDSAKGV